MSNLNKKILLFFMVVAVAFGLVGCTNPDNSVRIRFNVEEIEVRLNETKLLEPTIIKSSQVESVDLIFSSSDESIVKVEDGVLVPVAMGEAVVKVAWEDKDIIFDKVVVKVVKATLPRPTIAYDLAMLKGATQTVSVNLGSLNLTEAEYSFVALTPEIATISEEGVITAVAVGTAKFEIVVSDYEEEERYPISVTVAESDFAIKYELNGGTNHAENPVGYSALKLPLPLKDATKVGYEFLGWYENGNKVTEIAAGRLGDVELEAKWETEEYTISYEGIEGATFEAGYELPKAYTIESEEIVLGAPAKVGYKFLGWYAAGQLVEKIAKGSTGDVELEAKWEAVEYKISYDAKGGKLALYETFEEIAEAFLADYNKYSKTTAKASSFITDTSSSVKVALSNSEMLAKWNWLFAYMLEDLKAYNEANGTSNSDYAKDAISTYIPALVAGDTQAIENGGGNTRTLIRSYLHGILNKTQGNESTHAAFAKLVPDFSLEENQKALLAASSNVKTSYTIEEEVELVAPAKVGYEFVGWFNENGDQVEKIAKGSTGDVELEAKWEIAKYKISYDAKGGKLGLYETFEEIAEAFLADYNKYSNTTAKASSFITDTSASVKVALSNPEMLAKWNWLFAYMLEDLKAYNEGTTAWQYASYGKEAIEVYIPKLVAGDTNAINDGGANTRTLVRSYLHGILNKTQGNKSTHADFAKLVPDFSLEENQKALLAASSNVKASYTIEEEVELVAPTKVGYEFVGWFNEKGEKVEKIAKGSTGDVELEAKWEAVEYTISYELDGGVNAEGNPDKYTIETETITLAAPSKDGYIFVEWVEGDKVEKGSTGNKTFTAKWEVIPVYTISWDLAGGVLAEGETLVDSYKHGTPVALPTPTRYAHEFLGWYDGETKVTEIAGKNYELVAKWKNVTIVSDNLIVVYDLAGGNWQEGQVPDADHPFAEMVSYIPVKEGYSFVKWDVLADNTVTPSVTTFTAVWEVALVYNITYDLAGGVAPEGNPATYTEFTPTFTLVPATKEGYEFAGWYAGEQLVEKVELGSKGDLALVAKWTAAEYEINYDLAGGQWELTPYSTHEEIRNAFIADFEAYLNTFKEEDEKVKIPLEEDLTLDDEGKPSHTNDFFGVTYSSAGVDYVAGFFAAEQYAAKWGWLYSYIAATGTDLSSASLKRTNIHAFLFSKKFEKWPYSYDFSGTSYESYKANVPATLGKEFVPVTTYTHGNPIELPVPTKEGFEFAGWLLDGKPFEFTAQTSGELALVASWKSLIVATDLAVADADAKALQAISESGAAVIVYVKAELAEGDYKLVNANLSANLVVKGFATIAKALEYVKAESAQGVVYLAAGTYAENVNINVNDVTLAGANYGVAGNATRAEESAISGKITVAAKNIAIDGIKVTGGAESDNIAPISLDACENVKIQNCLLDALYGGLNASYNMNRRAMIAKISGTTAKDVVVSNNKIDFGGHSGTYLKVAIAGYGFNTLHFVNNEVTASHAGEYARVYDGLSSNIYVYGNTVPADAKFIVANGTLVETAQ